MATARPYFNKSIAELEDLHKRAQGDQSVNNALLKELNHRSTARAIALLHRLEDEVNSKYNMPTATAILPSPRQQITQEISTHTIASSQLRSHLSSPTNKPNAILGAWVALEALSPQTYRRPADLANGDSKCVAVLDGAVLPWIRGESSKRNFQLYYQVVLGSVPMHRATDKLIATFGEDEEPSRRENERAAIAAVLLDRNGYLLEENGVAISSFAWALPIALSGDLASLGNWVDVERNLIEKLTARLRYQNDDGAPLPLDRKTIDSAFKWLVATLKLPEDLFEAPSFAIRVFHYFKSKNPPEVALLNSFFLADLARASTLVAGGKAGKALTRYVGMDRPTHCPNLLTDRKALEELLAPAKIPAARWPAPAGHPLVTLQQAAVNAIRADFALDNTGVVAVNGPPGTGKTTLLRDIVAACVMDRALAMITFDDPMSAFSTTGQKIAAGGAAFLHLYRLDDSLKGHEVLVASSNNKAVENVSKELPSAKAIGREVSYFKTVADRLSSKPAEDGTLTAGEPSWGLIAAVLGNAMNRHAFQQAIWWDDDRSLRIYLKGARGDTVFREIKDGDGNVLRREVPTIISEEAPPSPEIAKTNWQKARKAFKAIHSEVEEELKKLEQIRQTCLQLGPARNALSVAEQARDAAVLKLDECLSKATKTASARSAAEVIVKNANQSERQMFTERPGWLARIFRTTKFRNWESAYSPIKADVANATRHFAQTLAEEKEAKIRADSALSTLKNLKSRCESASKTVSSMESIIETNRQALGSRLVDEHFFEQKHEQWNLSATWVPDTLHSKREDLFTAALAVHRAFIDVTAQKISHNLGVLMGAMQAGAFQDQAKKSLLGDLWSTLFLVVPTVSTTFASVDRMLGDLAPSSLGWLLIDEAGQATPQSAVGAIMRAKRTIVVGDPLQVPPVVSLPTRLTKEVCKYFNVSDQEWAAPDASVQTVADSASRFQAEFNADVGLRRVGLPLLVHRRCQDPMFGVSNRIAYDGQMVHAAGAANTGQIGRVLGPSAWFDVDGSTTTKWCTAEGEIVVRLLAQLASSSIEQPDIYIITPFKIVAQEMRRMLEAHQELFEKFDVDATDWIKNRVGTIHTFQGKEAEVVIAILGAPMAEQQGARKWACGTPNILNVMVSRAKQKLYVVGSKAAWSTVGHCQYLAKTLPTQRL